MVEQLPCKQKVLGSIPSVSKNYCLSGAIGRHNGLRNRVVIGSTPILGTSYNKH